MVLLKFAGNNIQNVPVDCSAAVIAKKLSVKRSCKIASAFVADGAKGNASRILAKIARERDLWRWLKLPVQLYVCKLPLLLKSSGDRKVVMERVAFILPSRILAEAQRRGALEKDVFGPQGVSTLLDYWRPGFSSLFLHCFD